MTYSITITILCLILLNRCMLYRSRTLWLKDLVLKQRNMFVEMYRKKGE